MCAVPSACLSDIICIPTRNGVKSCSYSFYLPHYQEEVEEAVERLCNELPSNATVSVDSINTVQYTRECTYKYRRAGNFHEVYILHYS